MAFSRYDPRVRLGLKEPDVRKWIQDTQPSINVSDSEGSSLFQSSYEIVVVEMGCCSSPDVVFLVATVGHSAERERGQRWWGRGCLLLLWPVGSRKAHSASSANGCWRIRARHVSENNEAGTALRPISEITRSMLGHDYLGMKLDSSIEVLDWN
ncbi:hypothetical protein SISSUDRAFT_294062 [Sistotremastrum suecicum HHB10207 ss-3]|uniref:Uncharacterized protein n=1 Tax=Sistotremastrum suecicum HHB10207 ss-3 TaxID=1314776 RepID=A0A165ZI37_9AGAM|nr:hypothetical protein SISSUDRAFT_294062 [Sistotremastrum suecicum HHB10207 ss-3]